MKKLKFAFCVCLSIIFTSCYTLKSPIINQISSLDDYTYFYVTPTQDLTSSAGVTISGQYYSSSKTVNPSDLISGYLIKQGYVRIPTIEDDKKHKTFIVNYGESGRRNLFLAYSIEVTMQFISASNHNIICVTTAEGVGDTEADDIRIAINRALDALFKK